VLITLFLVSACSDHDEDHGRDHKKESKSDRDDHREQLQSAPPVANVASTTYKQECGACHNAYFPGLLPTRSWVKLLANSSDHFGEQLPIMGTALDEVRSYLSSNAADVSGNERSRKIMKSIGSTTPVKITEIGYLRDKHHELSAEVFKRKSVGGFGNCLACHKGAEGGRFDDDDAIIPTE
jgi:hypothetical protein